MAGMSRRQAPTITDSDTLVDQALKEMRSGDGCRQSTLGVASVPQRTKRVMPGETKAEARARWEREAQLQDDRDRDPSRGPDGRRLPVRYE